jgi:hypothetical protein
MTAWASLLIPAGSAAAGGIVAGASAIWAQAVTQRGTSTREREARREAFILKRLDTERETLISLQDAIEEVGRITLNDLFEKPEERSACGMRIRDSGC